MILELKRAFREAYDELLPALRRLRSDGRIPVPWMGDPVSALVQEHYNRIVMDEASPYSAFGKLVKYHEELLNVYRALEAMERNYHDTEETNRDMIRSSW